MKSTFAEIARTYSVSANAELCGLAIALALDPRLVKSKDAATAKVLASSFAEIAANQALARGAFLAKYSSRLAAADLPTEERG